MLLRKTLAYLHWKVRVLLIVLKDISDSLVNHGEQWFQCSHASEIHDVFLLEGKLQALHNQAIRREMLLDNIHKVTLNLYKVK